MYTLIYMYTAKIAIKAKSMIVWYLPSSNFFLLSWIAFLSSMIFSLKNWTSIAYNKTRTHLIMSLLGIICQAHVILECQSCRYHGYCLARATWLGPLVCDKLWLHRFHQTVAICQVLPVRWLSDTCQMPCKTYANSLQISGGHLVCILLRPTIEFIIVWYIV